MNIYILRHGETISNRERRLQGQTDIPLNEYGIKLAEITRDGIAKEGIHFDRVYASPLSRAKHTARIVSGTDKITIDERIIEMGFGIYENILLDDIQKKPEYACMKNWLGHPSQYVAKNGAETYENVFARARDFLENELRPLEGKYENVLLVCHGAIIRALLLCLNGWELDRFWEIHQPNCCMNLITLKDGVFEIAYIEKIYYEGNVGAKGIF
jgi:broad specificity phosphatase PhoE